MLAFEITTYKCWYYFFYCVTPIRFKETKKGSTQQKIRLSKSGSVLQFFHKEITQCILQVLFLS